MRKNPRKMGVKGETTLGRFNMRKKVEKEGGWVIWGRLSPSNKRMTKEK